MRHPGIALFACGLLLVGGILLVLVPPRIDTTFEDTPSSYACPSSPWETVIAGADNRTVAGPDEIDEARGGRCRDAGTTRFWSGAILGALGVTLAAWTAGRAGARRRERRHGPERLDHRA